MIVIKQQKNLLYFVLAIQKFLPMQCLFIQFCTTSIKTFQPSTNSQKNRKRFYSCYEMSFSSLNRISYKSCDGKCIASIKLEQLLQNENLSASLLFEYCHIRNRAVRKHTILNHFILIIHELSVVKIDLPYILQFSAEDVFVSRIKMQMI